MDIVKEAGDFVRDLLAQLDGRHHYHDLSHTHRVLEAARRLGHAARLNQEEKEILLLAALFHDTGFVEVYEGHEQVSSRIAKEFLESKSYPAERIKKVQDCISVTAINVAAVSQLEMLMKDADLSNLGQEDYLEHLAKLRWEWEDFLQEKHTDEEWYLLNHKFLKGHRYYTNVARSLYGPQRNANQKRLKKMAKESKEKAKKGIQGSRSAQMMFKTSLRNHLDLSNLADNKANIMLSVNALIITIAMPFAASYIADQPYLLIPSIILLFTCLSSMIFATLATRPIKMNGFTNEEKIEKGESNLFFFGNFYRMSLQQYQKGMEKVIDNEQQLEGSIMRDLYFLGHSLGRKYSLLRICYNIFMIGIVLAVIAFSIAFLTHN